MGQLSSDTIMTTQTGMKSCINKNSTIMNVKHPNDNTNRHPEILEKSINCLYFKIIFD